VRRLLVLTVLAVAMTVSASASAAWSTYFGPGTFTAFMASPETAGYNNYTNNRVYRPIGHPFFLYYHDTNNNYHWSANDSATNPFYFASFGYNISGCGWNSGADGSTTVSPVTCEAFS
jgi:hypothetical protein